MFTKLIKRPVALKIIYAPAMVLSVHLENQTKPEKKSLPIYNCILNNPGKN
jgi:hypothetical protein